jgi:hypothetical protein
MITITLKIQTYKKYPPPLYIYKIIDLGDDTYLKKSASVSREEENLSVSMGSECLGIVMEEAKYISLYYRTYPSGNSKQ